MPPSTPIKVTGVRYLGQQTVALAGSSVALTLPGETTAFCIRAEGGDVYYAINESVANSSSGGFVPQNGVDVQGFVINLSSLRVYGGSGSIAHILYFEQMN